MKTSIPPAPADVQGGEPAGRTDAGAPVHRAGRRTLVTLLRHGATIAVLAAIGTCFVVPELRQAHWSQLVHIGIGWLVAGALLEGISLFCYSLLTRSLLPATGPGLLTVFRIDSSCTALGHVVPAGSAASAALGYRLYTGRGVKPGDVCFMMATQGPGSSIVLNLLLWAALLATIPLTGFHRVYLAAGAAGLAGLLAAAGLFFLFTKGEERAVRMARRAVGWIPRVREDAAERLVRALASAVRDFRCDPRRMRRSLAWATANWLLDAASLWCFVASLGHYANPVLLFAAFGIANVAAAFPLTPSGLGVIEATLPLLLAGGGVTKGIAALAVIGWRLVNFWLPIPIGTAAYISLHLPPGGRGRGARRTRLTREPPGRRTLPAPYQPEQLT